MKKKAVKKSKPLSFGAVEPVKKSALPQTSKVEAGQVLCAECESPIPPERLKLVKTPVCVRCMEDLERKGRGTVRHRMEFEVEGADQESFESLTLHIRRA